LRKLTGRPIPDIRRIFARSVTSAAYGWRRAHKHTDAPGEDAIVDQIVQGVLNEVCEYFDVDDEDRPA
jgi:predicted Zn-dependent protease with MMP-like domain